MRSGAYQDLTEAQARLRQAIMLNDGASVEVLDQGDGLFTLVFSFPDLPDPVDPLSQAGTEAVSLAPASAHAHAASPGTTPPSVHDAAMPPGAFSTAAIGRLSREFESNGRPAAIGRDRTGGFSYGQYQIACAPGTMATYLRFLEGRHAALFEPLRRAGGAPAAAAGTDAFKSAWRALAVDSAFAESQHAFIAETHFLPFIRNVRTSLGLDVIRRSAALRDVAWSVAVQHGANNTIFANALVPLGIPVSEDDKLLINAIYDERARVDVYFKNSTSDVKAAVADRFRRERALALAEIGPLDTAFA